MSLPSIPAWDGIHPAVVQFPVALLLLAPLLLLISLLAKESWRGWAGSALVAMSLGGAAAWLAVASGHAAGQLVDKTPELARAIAGHEASGVATRNLFTILALAMAVLILIEARRPSPLPRVWRNAISGAFLVLYVGCTLLLAQTAQRGGRLVHESGVRAIVGPPVAAATAAPTASGR